MYALISYDGVQYHSPILAMRKGVYANSYVVLNSEYNGLICVPDWKWYRDKRQSVRHVYILDADKSMFAKSKGWLAIPEFACAKNALRKIKQGRTTQELLEKATDMKEAADIPEWLSISNISDIEAFNLLMRSPSSAYFVYQADKQLNAVDLFIDTLWQCQIQIHCTDVELDGIKTDCLYKSINVELEDNRAAITLINRIDNTEHRLTCRSIEYKLLSTEPFANTKLILPCFTGVTKGEVEINDEFAEWRLGDMLLTIHPTINEHYISVEYIIGNKKKELAHLQASLGREFEELINKINDPDHVICVKNLLGIKEFMVIEKEKAKEGAGRYYSI